MPVFEYRATNESGEPITGTLMSQSVATAADALTSQGLTVQHVGIASNSAEVEAQNAALAAERPRVETPYSRANDQFQRTRYALDQTVWAPLMGGVALPDLMFFFRQLSTMMNAGVNMVQALYTLSGQTRDPKLRQIILEMRAHAEAGNPMSTAMVRYPEVFSPLMVSMVRAGEVGGNLDETLRETSDYIKEEIELRNLYRRVTLYPKIILAVSIVIILGANFIINMIEPAAQKLESPLTEPLIFLTVLAIGVGIFLFLRVGLKNPDVRYKWDRFVLSVPGFGKPLKQLAMAKFGRSVGALYKAGVPVADAVQMGADACGNTYLRSEMYPAVARLKEGAGITETLRQTGAFSPIVLDMTQTGETTGNLDQMLIKLSEFYEEDAKTRTHALGVATGVAIMLLVAIYVGYVYITNMAAMAGARMNIGEE